MKLPRTFLIADDNQEGSFLLTKTVLRSFPDAEIHELSDIEIVIAYARQKAIDVIIVHHTWDADAATLIRELRMILPTVPIIAVSGIDRAKATLAAGATRFLSFDEWLRMGTLVAEVLALGTGPNLPPAQPTRIPADPGAKG